MTDPFGFPSSDHTIQSSASSASTWQDEDSDDFSASHATLRTVTSSVPEFGKQVNREIFVVIKGFRADSQPVWMLDQTSDYLPEFCELRDKYGLSEICHNPELASEATLMPLRRFKFDAAIIFSDALVVPQALGLQVLGKPFTLQDLPKLHVHGALDRLEYVASAITLTRRKLKGKAALFGYSEAPWTLMTYMTEGGATHMCPSAKMWLYAHKNEARHLLALLSDVVADYCVMQAKAGAQVIQLFDRNAGVLSKDMYTDFCMPGLKLIRQRLRDHLKPYNLDVPMAIFPKGLAHSYEELGAAGFDVIGLDWCTEPMHVRNALPKKVCLQGNLDPCALYAPPHKIKHLVYAMLRKFEGSRVIANLGNGVYPDTPLQGVSAFVEAVKSYHRTMNESDTSSAIESLSA